MTEQIQQQLHESFYTACPDAILILKDGVISTCNPSAVTLFQTEKGDLVDKKLLSFIQKENIEEDKLINYLNGNLESTNYFECTIQNKKGINIDVRIFLIKIQAEQQTFTQALIRDITAQKEIERNNSLLVKKLEEQNRKTTAITEVLDKSAIVSMTDKEGLITKVNQEFCQISKYSEEELLGKSHNIVNSGYHDKEFWQSMWRDISRGKTWRADVKNKAKDGSFYWVDTVINSIVDSEGKIEGYLSIRYLITERKQHEFDIHIKNEQLATTEEELRQNLEELETQRDYIQEVNEEIKLKSAILEKNSQALLRLNKNPNVYKGDLDTAFEIITQKAAKVLNIERVGIWKYDTTDEAKIISQKQYEKMGEGQNFSKGVEIEQKDVPIYFDDLVAEKSIIADFAKNHPALVEFVDNYLTPLQIYSMLDIPYFIDGNFAGVICCETQGTYKNWTLEDIAFIKGISDIITLAIKTKQQLEEQEKVKQSEKLLFQFLDKIPVGITIIGSNKMMFYSNEISRRIFPYGMNPKEGAVTGNYQLNIAGTDIPYPKEKFPSSSVFKGIVSSRDDIEIIQDGKRTPIEISASPVYSETGEIIYAIAAVQDITERRAKELELKIKNDELIATEEEIRQNLEELQATQEALLETQLEQEKLVSVIRNVDALVAITDMEGNTEFLNDRGRILSGFHDNYLGKHISEFHNEEGAKIATEIILPVVMQQGFWKGEHQLQNYLTKELFQTLGNVFVIQDPNTKQPIALASVQLDITEQKNLEKSIQEQNEKLQASEEELVQNMEELLATQEAMEQKQQLIETTKVSLEKQNNKLEANEAVLKKAFQKMKMQDIQLRENLDALQTQEEELRQNMEELQTTQEVMVYQKDILEVSNRQITKSISYAETIQKAILPSKKLIKEVLPDSFVIYKPKDIVSGDFYWLSKHENKTLLGVIDCTGHGVPGAFMSLVGSNLLSEIINQKGILQPNHILQELHNGVVKKLNQKEGANNDGMDLTFCLIEEKSNGENLLTFAGVKQNLYIVRDKELIELKGNRRSIGGGKRDDNRNYKQEEIILQKNDAVFLATDGYSDQANEERKSFSKKKFRELMVEIGHLRAKEQMKILEQRLTQHQKNTEQRDDITVFGFKI